MYTDSLASIDKVHHHHSHIIWAQLYCTVPSLVLEVDIRALSGQEAGHNEVQRNTAPPQ